ncbi:MAG TPA: 1,2-phenylacetyl-CoA epoxidase subunit PaaC [Flavisolibacter sp.]|nr:1,2-phenylacetyl-CoA epoxidase subunit PaaC [Flavisolibacter sp.]
MNASLFQYTLHLADNTLILGQRNSEWTGHGPVLEQDIAITNISLDLLGQARNFYDYAATLYNHFNKEEKEIANHLVPRLWKTFDRNLNEDDLAFLREERQYLNLLLAELPKGDWAQTILRQFFFSAFQFYQYSSLKNSSDPHLAAIAEKSVKEVTYHLRWSSEWVIRLGDGTEESNKRIKKALDELWPFTGELFTAASFEQQATNEGYGVEMALLKEAWLQRVSDVFTEAALQLPVQTWMQSGGKEGKHTEHMGYLLTDMQYLQRAYPNATW